MSRALNVPFVGKEFLDFRIMEWLVAEGQEIAPGTDVCVLRAVTRQRVERWRKSKPFRRNKGADDAPEKMKIRHHPPLVHVTAGEAGTVSEIVRPTGTLVRQGEEIARIHQGDDEGGGGQFYAVANMMGIDHEGAG